MRLPSQRRTTQSMLFQSRRKLRNRKKVQRHHHSHQPHLTSHQSLLALFLKRRLPRSQPRQRLQRVTFHQSSPVLSPNTKLEPMRAIPIPILTPTLTLIVTDHLCHQVQLMNTLLLFDFLLSRGLCAQLKYLSNNKFSLIFASPLTLSFFCDSVYCSLLIFN